MLADWKIPAFRITAPACASLVPEALAEARMVKLPAFVKVAEALWLASALWWIALVPICA